MHQNQTIDPSKEAHKIFDEVFISVRSGDGGNGEVVESNRGKMVDNFKYNPGGSQPKRMWLPASDPADGANGADVILICDPALGDLLHLHEQAKGSSSSGRGGGVGGMKAFVGRRGSNANPAVGSGGPKNNKKIKKASTPPLIINVPPGTVVKRKSNGVMLGELLSPGDSLVVARGGEGGRGVRAPTRESNQREMKKQFELAEESGAEVVAVEDNAWKQETHGLQGEQFSLHLTLRVVADVGIVGYPNAGKVRRPIPHQLVNNKYMKCGSSTILFCPCPCPCPCPCRCPAPNPHPWYFSSEFPFSLHDPSKTRDCLLPLHHPHAQPWSHGASWRRVGGYHCYRCSRCYRGC